MIKNDTVMSSGSVSSVGSAVGGVLFLFTVNLSRQATTLSRSVISRLLYIIMHTLSLVDATSFFTAHQRGIHGCHRNVTEMSPFCHHNATNKYLTNSRFCGTISRRGHERHQ